MSLEEIVVVTNTLMLRLNTFMPTTVRVQHYNHMYVCTHFYAKLNYSLSLSLLIHPKNEDIYFSSEK